MLRQAGGIVVAALTVVWCSARAPMSNPQPSAEARESFLRRVELALEKRDATALLALSDTAGWSETGRPPAQPASLRLPPAPLTRVRLLSETEALYRDGGGREWRLSLQGDEKRGWSLVLHDRACPSIGMQRGIEFERRPAPEPPPGVWTPLECWPLPK